jgi:hypothetical protein
MLFVGLEENNLAIRGGADLERAALASTQHCGRALTRRTRGSPVMFASTAYSQTLRRSS